MTLSFPDGAAEGTKVTLDNVTYTLRNGVWKAEVYYYDLENLDDDYVNVFGDVMAGDLEEEGDTFPGTIDSDESLNINFSGNVRVDSMSALENLNPIQLVTLVDDNGDNYDTGFLIDGKPFLNYNILVSKPSTVRSFVVPAGQDVTRSYQWQQAIIDTTATSTGFDFADPVDGDFSDIAVATDTSYKITVASTGYDYYTDFPDKVLFIRCIETISDSRGSVCLVGGTPNQSCDAQSTSNYIGPITPTQDLT